MYSLCGKKRFNYYLKVRDIKVRLISCLPDSNRNSAGEYVRVRGKWFVDDVPDGKSGFVSHTKLTAEATFMNLFHYD